MEETDNSWIFDSLVAFLNGPVWNVPLRNFIEEKSLIFDPKNCDGEEHKKVFQDYKALVDVMLSSYMEDINISSEQFEEACNRENHDSLPSEFDQNLFEQIWAANDFDMFKRMMAQRNVELQLEALELLEHKYGITPESFIPHGHSVPSEVQVMKEVTKKFPGESSTVKKELPSEEEVQYLHEEKQVLQDTLKKTKEKKSSGTKNEQLEAEISFDKKPISKEVDSAEMRRRQEYLRSQRDKLVALKKEARKKQLFAGKMADRPKSAQVAEAIVEGNATTVNPETKIRKNLVERLKNEVVSKMKK